MQEYDDMMNFEQHIIDSFNKKHEILMQIFPKSFTINNLPDVNVGFIHSELINYFPESTKQIGIDDNGNPIYSFDYMPIIALLVNCVKDLQTRVLQLESI